MGRESLSATAATGNAADTGNAFVSGKTAVTRTIKVRINDKAIAGPSDR